MHKPPYPDPRLDDSGLRVHVAATREHLSHDSLAPASLGGDYILHKDSPAPEYRKWVGWDGRPVQMVAWNLWLYKTSVEDAIRVYLQLVGDESLADCASYRPTSVEFLPTADPEAPHEGEKKPAPAPLVLRLPPAGCAPCAVTAELPEEASAAARAAYAKIMEPQQVRVVVSTPEGDREFLFEQGSYLWWQSYCAIRSCFEEVTGFEGDLERVPRRPSHRAEEQAEFVRRLGEYEQARENIRLVGEAAEAQAEAARLIKEVVELRRATGEELSKEAIRILNHVPDQRYIKVFHLSQEGMTRREIATQVRMSPGWVQGVVSWFREKGFVLGGQRGPIGGHHDRGLRVNGRNPDVPFRHAPGDEIPDYSTTDNGDLGDQDGWPGEDNEESEDRDG